LPILGNLNYLLMSNSHSASVQLQVNGETRDCPAQTSLPAFLESINLNPQLVAVEYNGEILQRPLWSQTIIQQDDRLEIVTIVGGG
jgi:sulfur carrier protein